MNTELIKKYKAEFDHFLNDGKVICRTESDGPWHNVDNSTWEIESDIVFIINDDYVEFRKALCEGKTIQFKDLTEAWNDLKDPKFKEEPRHYRIKPEEPKFKIGDFVRDIISGKISQVNNEDIANGKYSQVTKWEPSTRELCWFWSGNKLEEATLSKFHSYTKHGVFKTIYDSFKYCEPFLNSKPSWFKD